MKQIEQLITDHCTAPVALTCQFSKDQISLNEMTMVTGYMCKVQNHLVIEFPKSKIQKINGDHSVNHEINNVTAFIVISQTMKFLPLELSKAFPRIETLLVDQSKLHSLQKNDFAGCRELRKILIRHNDLASIDDGTFDDLTQLEYIDLSSNNINSMPSKLFSTLIHLKQLILSNNQLSKLSAALLPRRNSIEEFHVSSNKLDQIETKILKSLTNAKFIDFTGNSCVDVSFDKNMSFIEFFFEIGMKCCVNECF
jgi:Leucine-rich repeat (LRR) protein